MAKKLIGDYGSYNFDPANNRVNFILPAGVNLEQERILLITNVAAGQIIYNFANPALGGNVSVNALNLVYDTSSMNSSDPLQIWYWVAESGAEVTDVTGNEQLTALRQLAQTQAANMPMPDNAGRLRVILEGTNNLNSISSLTTVSTVSTVTAINNIAGIGGLSTNNLIPALIQIAVEIQMQKISIT